MELLICSSLIRMETSVFDVTNDCFRNQDLETSKVGDIFMVLGASGGSKIITAILHVFLNFAILGMPLFEAITKCQGDLPAGY